MIPAGLSLDQSPPLHVSFRFFLTAPIIGILAALGLFFVEPQLLYKAMLPQTIALTHFLTLGVLSMAMVGAYFQLLPVMAGAIIGKPNLIASLVYGCLLSGFACLILFFYTVQKVFLYPALPLLLVGLGLFAVVCIYNLLAVPTRSPSLQAMVFANLSLLITIVLGVLLALSYSGILYIFPRHILLQIHLLWGLGGWFLLTLFGVSYQIIPMFYVAPKFNKNITILLNWALFGGILLYSIAAVLPGNVSVYLLYPIKLCLLLAVFFYGAYTLLTLKRKKRKLPDSTVRFWKAGLYFLILTCLLFLVYAVLDKFESLLPFSNRHEILEYIRINMFIAFLVGGMLTIINGMIYKIVPFLIWFHLFSKGAMKAPSMKQIISEKQARGQFYFHITGTVTLLLACLYPPVLLKLAALIFLLNFGFLLLNLSHALRQYVQVKATIVPIPAPE